MMGISAFAMACCWVDNVGSWVCIKMRPLFAIWALEVLQYTQISRSPYLMFLVVHAAHTYSIEQNMRGYWSTQQRRKHVEPEGDLLFGEKKRREHVLVFYYTSTEPKE
uniref:Uncharacterized protein n=1 Tax=Oryza punctata TaxID=4537 RepID=A0A0E0M0S8_ORYPU